MGEEGGDSPEKMGGGGWDGTQGQLCKQQGPGAGLSADGNLQVERRYCGLRREEITVGFKSLGG